MQTLWTL